MLKNKNQFFGNKRNWSLIRFFFTVNLTLQYAVVGLQVGFAAFCYSIDFAGTPIFLLFFAFKKTSLFESV